MTKNEFVEEVGKLGINITPSMLEKLELYKDYLKEYNEHTNLTAIKEDNEIYLKHFYDSLTIVKAINLEEVKTLLDIGTGAGFPGMVLKIVFPDLQVTLLDSNNKKTKFLTSLKEKLGLNVEIINKRVEEFAKNNMNKFDIVTSRAVANLRVLSELSLPLVKVGGYFVPLKSHIEIELEEAKDTLDLLNGKIVKHISFNLYNEEGLRNILVIKKEKITSEDNLRSYDKILKKPLKKEGK